jgi:hypothetical protein
MTVTEPRSDRTNPTSLEVTPTGQSPRDFALTLRASDRTGYVRKVILDLLDDNRADGLTISDVEELTGFNRDTVAKHLDVLVASREVYKAGTNSARYHKNGRVLHYHHMDNKVFGKRQYTFYYLNNPEGDFIYIQEKKVGRFQTVETKGGIMISTDELPKFIGELSAFARDVAKEQKK